MILHRRGSVSTVVLMILHRRGSVSTVVAHDLHRRGSVSTVVARYTLSRVDLIGLRPQNCTEYKFDEKLILQNILLSLIH